MTNGPVPSPGISVTALGAPSPGRGMYVMDRVNWWVSGGRSVVFVRKSCFRIGEIRFAIGGIEFFS